MGRFFVSCLLALLLATPATLAGAGSDKGYYRWTDGSGTLHFSRRLEDVPKAHRADAKPVQPRKFSTTPSTPTPSKTSEKRRRPGRRPYSRVAPHVVIYTAPWCGWCRKALAHLDKNGVSYVQKDIEKTPAYRDELIRKAGRASIPVIEINGELLRGFDPSRIDALLARP